MSDTKRCATCKHWKPPVKPSWVVGECELAEGNDKPNAMAFFVDGYDNSGTLNTGPDFGCIHHEDK